MRPLLLAAPGDEELARLVARHAEIEVGQALVRDFPDGETYVRVDSDVVGRTVWILCSLCPAREKLSRLFFLASTVRDLGAARVRLMAPYLAYLRQDSRFHPGEGVTSVYVARLLSDLVDDLVTVDPHLHRYQELAAVYRIPARVVSSAPRIAAWVLAHVERPVIVGPDAESAQWAEGVAARVGCPVVVLDKVRHGDREVAVAPPTDAQRDALRGMTPVLIDDILSTGRTMVEALRAIEARSAVCVAVHAVFAGASAGLAPAPAPAPAGDPQRDLERAGAARIVTCNTIPHASNRIDLSDLLAAELTG